MKRRRKTKKRVEKIKKKSIRKKREKKRIIKRKIKKISHALKKTKHKKKRLRIRSHKKKPKRRILRPSEKPLRTPTLNRLEVLNKLKNMAFPNVIAQSATSPAPSNVIQRFATPTLPSIMDPNRAGTGVNIFDKMTSGGFERESINLVVGGSGSGKTILAVQFLLEGVKKGENVLYITFEEKKEDFYNNMKKFGWDLEAAEKSGKFIFLEYSPEKIKMMLDEGGGTVENIVLKYQIRRMVIDSITSFAILFDNELERRQSILGLLDILRKWDCTILLTVQHDPLSKKDDGISSIEFEADSVVLLYYTTLNNKRQRFIEILKMRGTDHSKEIVPFFISRGGAQIGFPSQLKSGQL